MTRILLLVFLTAPTGAQVAASSAPAASAEAAPSVPGTLESSKVRLDAHDAAGALADAEAALANGGGADAYAARADAKRALGRPVDDAIADYAEAAKLDPRYLDKYNGLIAQRDSEAHPEKSTAGSGLDGVPIGGIATGAAAGVALLAVGVLAARKRGGKPPAPDDEVVRSGGKADAPETGAEKRAPDAGQGAPPPDGPKKP